MSHNACFSLVLVLGLFMFEASSCMCSMLSILFRCSSVRQFVSVLLLFTLWVCSFLLPTDFCADETLPAGKNAVIVDFVVLPCFLLPHVVGFFLQPLFLSTEASSW